MPRSRRSSIVPKCVSGWMSPSCNDSMPSGNSRAPRPDCQAVRLSVVATRLRKGLVAHSINLPSTCDAMASCCAHVAKLSVPIVSALALIRESVLLSLGCKGDLLVAMPGLFRFVVVLRSLTPPLFVESFYREPRWTRVLGL